MATILSQFPPYFLKISINIIHYMKSQLKFCKAAAVLAVL